MGGGAGLVLGLCILVLLAAPPHSAAHPVACPGLVRAADPAATEAYVIAGMGEEVLVCLEDAVQEWFASESAGYQLNHLATMYTIAGHLPAAVQTATAVLGFVAPDLATIPDITALVDYVYDGVEQPLDDDSALGSSAALVEPEFPIELAADALCILSDVASAALQHVRALRLARRALAISPDSYDACLRVAGRSLDAGFPEDTLALVNDCMPPPTASPAHAALRHTVAGDAALKLERWSEAVDAHLAALSSDPANSDLKWNLLSATFRLASSTVSGIALSSNAIDPDLAAELSAAARLLHANGATATGLELLAIAVRLPRSSVKVKLAAYAAMASLQLESGANEAALSSLETGISIAPKSPVAHAHLAVALADAGDPRAALEAFATARRLITARDQLSFAQYEKLGLVAHTSGAFELAGAAFRNASRLAPTTPRAFINCGVSYARADQLRAALACFQRAHALDRHDVDVVLETASLAARLNRSSAAILYTRGITILGHRIWPLSRATQGHKQFPSEVITYAKLRRGLARWHAERSGEEHLALASYKLAFDVLQGRNWPLALEYGRLLARDDTLAVAELRLLMARVQPVAPVAEFAALNTLLALAPPPSPLPSLSWRSALANLQIGCQAACNVTADFDELSATIKAARRAEAHMQALLAHATAAESAKAEIEASLNAENDPTRRERHRRRC
ncbi:uncharacterized protein AMSG_08754 [Thecamonas trahens ATCC 50062]|uniref:Uncharacterized protein n=1 Tax=Thecamonas trahens ATCC 50062 TaxID=461836 RepID=A0A0L0DLS0_THETB|nr:hypothetical protein AMSG_08754 [Thecamonas trahens ATCC 50062]KNC53264.1 hypothetical protein AMSG_08754 [Thecamonas trahens ATCC 50062]|eukprot:XP_013754528.1 hypothetical protein AMSG_08754 [Thecamonas trahens ATCC 50062]